MSQQVVALLEKLKLPTSWEGLQKSDNNTKLVVYAGAGVGAVLALSAINKAYGTDPIGRTLELFGKFAVQEKKRNINVNEVID
eukprot:gene21462-25900_t